MRVVCVVLVLGAACVPDGRAQGAADGGDAAGASRDASADAAPGPTDAAPGPMDAAAGPTDAAPGPMDAAPGPRDAAAPRDAGPNPRLDLDDNTLLDLGRVACTAVEGEGADYCRIATDYSGMVYDSVGHRMLVFGGGHASTMTDAIQAFDLTTLTWSDLYAPTPCSSMVTANVDPALGAWQAGPAGPYPRPISAHTYDLVGFWPPADELILIGRLFTAGTCASISNDYGGPIAHYSMAGVSWSFSADPGSAAAAAGIAASEYDPISGQFISLGSSGLLIYDPVQRTASASFDALSTPGGARFDFGVLGYANHLTYYPPTDRYYYFVRGQPVRVFELTLDRAQPGQSTIEEVPTSGPSSGHQEPGYDYDSVNQIIGGAVTDGRFHAFDPRTRTWTQELMTGGAPGSEAFHAIAYDAIDNVFVFRTAGRTWAYRYRR